MKKCESHDSQTCGRGEIYLPSSRPPAGIVLKKIDVNE